MQSHSTTDRLAFGLFEVDVQAGELWKSGFRVKLQSQPFKILVALLEQPGQVVTREDLQALVWGKSTNVDFDHSLGTAVNKIREALGDSADNPRFIETLARRGYRFIAPVQTLGAPPVQAEPSLPAEPATQVVPAVSAAAVTPARSELRWQPILVAALVAALLTGLIVARIDRAHPVTVPLHLAQITHSGHFASTIVTTEDILAAATDGTHLYATTLDHGQARLAAVALTGGAVFPLDVPAEIASPAVSDISPDGSRLLVRDHLSPESEQPLWVIPTLGGSAQRVGNVLAHDATWMPDGQNILFANGNRLLLASPNGQNPELYASFPGRAFWLRWSPDGTLLRFTVVDPIAHTVSLWQLTAKDRLATRVLPDFSNPSTECCGVWADGGRSFVFQSNHDGATNLWRLDGNSTTDPVRVTDGPLEFQSPVASRTGSRIFFLGTDTRSELDRLTSNGELVPLGGLLTDAVRMEYSRDKQWVAWTDTSGHLWRARTDGNERIQLTADKLDVFMARWSPDGSHLALMARAPGKAWTLYLMANDGSDLRPLLNESRNAADPSWSPDGNTLVFGRTNDRMGSEAGRTLEFLDLKTGATRAVPHSEDLFSPRWSPDGRYIAALSLDQRHVSLFDVAAQTWHPLSLASGADPLWSPDSHSLILHGALNRAQPIQRVSIPDGKVETIAQLGTATSSNAVMWVLSGLALDGSPLVRTRMHTGDIFSLDLKR